jgi:cobalamin biosynthesis protein CbiG
MITITSDYRTDLKAARAAGIKFSKQPTAIALYDAIADFNALLDLPPALVAEMSALDVLVSDHLLDIVLQAAAETSEVDWEGTEGISDEQILNFPDNRGNLLSEYTVLSILPSMKSSPRMS